MYILCAQGPVGLEREMFYLTTHSTHFIYGYMVLDIWLRTILIVRKETRCRHIGYSYWLTARVFYMHHSTDRITHTTASSRGALAGTRNSSMGPPWRIDLTSHRTTSEHSYHSYILLPYSDEWLTLSFYHKLP